MDKRIKDLVEFTREKYGLSHKQEQYVLSPAQVEELALEQLKLVEFPNMEQKKLISAYAMEEIYIKNDRSSTLPFELFTEEPSRLQMDKAITWEPQIQKPFHRKEVTFAEDVVTPEQAFQCEPHPDLRPLMEEEINKCLSAIQRVLSQEYVNDSGKWIVKSLYREKGYIHAALKRKEQKEYALKRKMMLFIDSETYEVSNYMDNKSFLDMYTELKVAEKIKVMKEEAFEKLKDLIELKPYYVYDSEQGNYVLCGKLDCNDAVNACNGKIVALSEL